MNIHYLTNERGEITAVQIPIQEYERLLDQKYNEAEFTEEYKAMIDKMLEEEATGSINYLSFETIKERFHLK